MMQPEEALRHIRKLIDGSEDVEDAAALRLLIDSIRTLVEKGHASTAA